ncbi:alanine racemase [Tuberibacillus sp. Marseille-P3662]|uniref:alanine racemase n=1 Tax=Tuberibacillus sp. Marseille-P3662 TaxID=1965358 RepID=UPI000A1CF1BC|nr:alanine racemase [Tuberibacillus sp. Marseille-P3662]
MERKYYRDTWAEINLDAISANVRSLRSHLPGKTEIMAVVKADGYGHGAYQAAVTALNAGATWLGVALLDEALELREQGVQAPILVMGWVRPKDVAVAAEHHISLTVFQEEWLDQAQAYLPSYQMLFLHLKVDTGMGRIGVRTVGELDGVIEKIKSDRQFILEGVFTHFSTADEDDPTYFNLQYRTFNHFLSQLQNHKVNPNIVHCGNSAAALKHADKMFNAVRYGIAMYGLSPGKDMNAHLPFPLEEAFSLKSQIIHVKKMNRGEAISYGATYYTNGEEWIGTVPIGYGDGWPRRLQDAELLVGEHRCPVVGRICMDQLMCRLPEAVPIGTPVTLIGSSPSGSDGIAVGDIAEELETIPYEIPCMINARVPRLYFKNKGHMDE